MATAHAAASDAAENTHAAAMAAEKAERELNTAINQAVAETEEEIFADAMGDEPFENDGDTSLEAMGDGLEGEVFEDDDIPIDEEAVGEEQAARARARRQDEAAQEDDAGAQPEASGDQEQAQANNGRFVPRARLDDEVRKGREREAHWSNQLATLQGQLLTLQQLMTRPQPQRGQGEQPPAKPDMFSEPEAYETWLRESATRDAVTLMRQEQVTNHQNGVERNFAQAAQGERGFEFGPAYQTLMSLDRSNPQYRQLMQSIYYAPDPSAALFQWWDATVGPHFRAATAHSALSRLTPELRDEVFSALGPSQQRAPSHQRGQPRHEFRPAQTLPSLNSATGSNVHRSDPDLFDNSDASVFSFATR
jgi:hypothetical protein